MPLWQILILVGVGSFVFGLLLGFVIVCIIVGGFVDGCRQVWGNHPIKKRKRK